MAQYDDDITEEKIVEMAESMNKLSQAQRTKVKKTKRQNRAAETEKIIESVEEESSLPVIQVKLTEQYYNGMQALAMKTKQSVDETAHDIIVEKLSELGFDDEE